MSLHAFLQLRHHGHGCLPVDSRVRFEMLKKIDALKKGGYLVGVEHLPAHLCAHVDELLDPLLRVRVADQAHEVLFSEGDDL